jgi:hypothetical protein
MTRPYKRFPGPKWEVKPSEGGKSTSQWELLQRHFVKLTMPLKAFAPSAGLDRETEAALWRAWPQQWAARKVCPRDARAGAAAG